MYGSRSAIWIRTLFVLVVYCATIYALDRVWLSPRLESRPLALALAFAVAQTSAILVMLFVLLTRRGIAQRRARRSHTISAEAHDAVAEHAAGQDRLRVLRGLQQESRRDVAAAVASFLFATRGTMQDRVAALARDLGITPAEVEAGGTVERAAAGTLYDRAVIADQTQSRAEEIAQKEIPRALATGDPRLLIAALDLLRAWRRAFPVERLEHAFVHPDPEVRSRAFAVIPYVQPSHVHRIPNGLHDRDPRVRKAAAETAGKLRHVEATAALEIALRDEDRNVAVMAAMALATMPEGVARLQRFVTSGERAAATVAFEALEKATLGRLEIA